MATISNNEIKIKYSLDTTDLANATALFDRLNAEDRKLLDDLKRLKKVFEEAGKAGEDVGKSVGGGSKAAIGSINDLRNKVSQLQTQFNNLSPAAKNYQAVLQDLKKAKDNLKAATDAANKSLGETDKQLAKSKASFDLFGSSIKQVGLYLGTYFSIQSIVSLGKQILNVTKTFESLQKAIEFTSGTMTQGIVNFEFLKKLAEELGLPLQTAAEAFKSFSAAAQRSNISMEQQQQMFTDLSKAMSALQVTAQDAQLIFYGFSQMMSKAKVSTQELVLQISERLPIAMDAAATAVGRMQGITKVTTGELMNLISQGKILSEKFVPEFTKALGELAGGAAYTDTLGKGLTRLSNAWDEMLLAMGESRKGFIKDTIESLTEMLNTIRDLFPESAAKKIQVLAYDTEKENIKKLSDAGKEYTKEQLEQKLAELETVKNVEAQKLQAIEAGAEAANKAMGGGIAARAGRSILESLGLEPEAVKETKKTQEELTLSIADTQGRIDAYREALLKLVAAKKEDSNSNETSLNEYKKLIAQQEALKKAEEDLIKARTRPGYERDIQLLQNNVKFNEEMIKIDEDKRFKDLELAKNNAVKRKAENVKDRQEELNILKKANDEALKIQQDFLEKSNEELRKAQDKRRQDLQTDQQNELEESKRNQKERLDNLVKETNKALAVQALAPETRVKLMQDLQDQMTRITKEGEAERLAIEQYYQKKFIAETKQSMLEATNIMIQAEEIRLTSLTNNEIEKVEIRKKSSLAQLEVQRETLMDEMKANAENTRLSVEEIKNRNRVILAQLKLLEAQGIDITKQAEQAKNDIRAQKLSEYLNQVQSVINGLFDLYSRNLQNEMVLMNRRYDEEIRLADGNKQKITEIEEKRREQEKAIRLRQFRAEQMQTIANIWFAAAPQLVANSLNPILQAVIAASAAAQTAIVLAQPVPEFAEGTKGRKFKGGPAIVGERGVEKVITESGKVYYTPNRASLVELPKGSQVIPNHALTKQELFIASQFAGRTTTTTASPVVGKLDEIGGILKGLPIHQISMDERGFEKFIRTPRRTTKILNNRFGIKS